MTNIMAIDLEWKVNRNQYEATSPWENELLLVACAMGDGREFVWDVRADTIPEWFTNELFNPSTVKIVHNVAADTQYIFKQWGKNLENTWCSLMNERLLYLGDKSFKCGLKDVLERRFGVLLNKNLRDNLANG